MKLKRYGLPYMGSKSRIAPKIINLLPSAEKLYDVFAGGCAITHAALLSGKWSKVIANDITDAPKLFEDTINGKYHNEKRWISREDFFRLKDTDPYVRICWSFGNNQKYYLYSRQIEPYKQAVHKMLHGETVKERRLEFKNVLRKLREIGTHRPGDLQSLESLERLQSLESLEITPPDLETYALDYKDITIGGDAVIYCDPPYKGVGGYTTEFDHEAFYDWCCEQTAPIYISEYAMPEDRFECVSEFDLVSTLSATNNNKRVKERIFIPRK